jgi:hypothetical protein
VIAVCIYDRQSRFRTCYMRQLTHHGKQCHVAPFMTFRALLNAKELEKGKMNISPKVIKEYWQSVFLPKYWSIKHRNWGTLATSPKNNPELVYVFLWVKLTIGISRKKISNPFKDNKGHFETPLIQIFRCDIAVA